MRLECQPPARVGRRAISAGLSVTPHAVIEEIPNVHQIGANQDAFFEVYGQQVLPRVREELSAASPA